MNDQLDIAFDELSDSLDKCGTAFTRNPRDLAEIARCRENLKEVLGDVREFSRRNSVAGTNPAPEIK